ncbi:hypothetical protein [Nannocystis radixulma]|uniref:Uncharacterized protein n=1 Tax=Nannocystis radixulma TaxID=2995305 RepID=A0ABT5BP71_9BACT|nr:hypothetical protein [Nannocystis radixulma]MDC0675943.1 hypothetical protein [Nannocystis radixulma]
MSHGQQSHEPELAERVMQAAPTASQVPCTLCCVKEHREDEALGPERKRERVLPWDHGPGHL